MPGKFLYIILLLLSFEVKSWLKLGLSLFQIRIETDPADRTQLRMTVASGDPTLTFEYVFTSEF